MSTKTMDKTEFTNIIEQHKLFLDSDGKQGKRAEIRNCKLKDFGIGEVVLTKAILDNVVFQDLSFGYIRLDQAKLNSCVFTGCDMHSADFSDSVFGYVNFMYCGLSNSLFRGAKLTYIKFWHSVMPSSCFNDAVLHDCNFRYSNVGITSFSDSNLRTTFFDHCQLLDSYFFHTVLNWNDHELLGEILRQAAGKAVDKRQLSGLVSTSKDLCWKDFLQSTSPHKEWALKTLANYIRPNDNHPCILDDYN